MSMLITGFEPFGALKENPSSHLAHKIANIDWNVDALTLPTSYRRSVEAINYALTSSPMSALIMLGYAVGVEGVRLERYGRNESTSQHPDNDGRVLQGPIDSHGPPVLESTVDINKCANLIGKKCPVVISENAGGYVCNYAYYCALRSFPEIKCIFVHLSSSVDSDNFRAVMDAVVVIAAELQAGRALANHM
ncbi:hypothetical protein ACRS5S_09105 [Nocardia asiatica]|uniref:pyroglutamyl-peptidase I family protein n=1 Tax=Nocardia asiatica TaxID=209252 RepID=UPI003EDF4BA7